MSNEYRIIKKSFSKDKSVYIIQSRVLFWWWEAVFRNPVNGHYWEMQKTTLDHAKETLKAMKDSYEKPKIEVVEPF